MANEKRLIDANEFLDLFYVASAGQDKEFVKTVEMVVEDTPTVDAVCEVYGRWKSAGLGDYLCSACWGQVSGSNRFNYCPNCGAKMDGGNEDV